MRKPMTKERLADLRQMRDYIRRQPYSDYGFSYQEDIADAVDAIDRLRNAIESVTLACADFPVCRSTAGHDPSCPMSLDVDALLGEGETTG